MAHDYSRKVPALVFMGSGENCHDETVFAYKQVGAEPEKILYKKFLQRPKVIRDFPILDFPGGFLDGDDLGAAKAMAYKFKKNEYVMEEIERHIKKGCLIKGTCNGFQLLVKAGILPGLDGNYRDNSVTLTYNDSGRFENRWVWMEIDGEKSPWTKWIRRVELPVRHGEGKFVPKDESILKRLKEDGLIIGRYVGRNGEKNPGYPYNPNGSVDDAAMICDPTGQLMGLMPHPEAYQKRTNHPRWTREDFPEEGAGLQFFRNGVAYARSL